MGLGQRSHKRFQLVSPIPDARLLESPQRVLQEFCQSSSEILRHILMGTMLEQMQ